MGEIFGTLAEYIPQAPVNDEAKRANGNLANDGVYNPVNFHVYHYANNNPIKYSDPDGRIPFMVVTGIVGALIGGGASIASDLMSGEDVNWAKAGAYAVAGGLAGATLGGVAATVATGSALTAGSATASFSTVTGVGTAGIATASSATVALPYASDVAKIYAGILTPLQISTSKTIINIIQSLTSHKNLTGTKLDAGHITKLTNSLAGLKNNLHSLQGSLRNKNLSSVARTFLLNVETNAKETIMQIEAILGGLNEISIQKINRVFFSI